jgi:hypothetical protein
LFPRVRRDVAAQIGDLDCPAVTGGVDLLDYNKPCNCADRSARPGRCAELRQGTLDTYGAIDCFFNS